jgi:hypothetical protein
MEVRGQLYATIALPHEQDPPPGTHWIGIWVGPKVGLDRYNENKSLPPHFGNRTKFSNVSSESTV